MDELLKHEKMSQNSMYIISLLIYNSKTSKLYTIFLHNKSNKKKQSNGIVQRYRESI